LEPVGDLAIAAVFIAILVLALLVVGVEEDKQRGG
jgi:hypothetical protein